MGHDHTSNGRGRVTEQDAGFCGGDTQIVETPYTLEPGNSSKILDGLEGLLDGLSNGDVQHTEESLLKLGAPQETELYRRVGELTRTLHNALADFRQSLASSSVTMHSTNVSDAATKIENVIQMTQESAERTLTSIEEQSVLINQTKDELGEFLTQLAEGSDPGQNTFEVYFKSLLGRCDRLDDLCNDILMAQSFQDLTGQSLKKVLKLVLNLEGSLLELVTYFGDVEPLPQVAEEEAPAIMTDPMKQGDVDDILSKFGF